MMWGLKSRGTEADSPLLKFSVRADVIQNQYIQKEWRRGKSHEYCLWTFVHIECLWNIQAEMSEFWDLKGLESENIAAELSVCSWGYLKPKGSNFSVNYEAELFVCGLGSVGHLLLFTQLCLILCGPMECSTPGFPVVHHLLKFISIELMKPFSLLRPQYSHTVSCPSPGGTDFDM